MRPYYTQTREKNGRVIEEVIREIEDGDNIILDRDGRVIVVIKYAEVEV